MLFFMVLSCPVQASLVNQGAFTSDTVSGLDWMKWETTKGQSYDYIMGEFGVGGAYEGWRYANTGEALNFLSQMGISGYTGTWQYAGPAGWDTLTSFMGKDTSHRLDYHYIYAMVETAGEFVDSFNHANYQGDLNFQYATFHYRKYHEFEYLGSFLIRETVAVPSPSTLALFGLGLFGFALRCAR